MKPHELIARLVLDTKKPTLQVAAEIDKASFQGTLYKFIKGRVPNPSRGTASKIARYFGLPIDALYEDQVATRIAREKGLLGGVHTTLIARETPPASYVPVAGPPDVRLSAAIEQRIRLLQHDQLKALESIIVAYLNAVAPATPQAKRRRS